MNMNWTQPKEPSRERPSSYRTIGSPGTWNQWAKERCCVAGGYPEDGASPAQATIALSRKAQKRRNSTSEKRFGAQYSRKRSERLWTVISFRKHRHQEHIHPQYEDGSGELIHKETLDFILAKNFEKPLYSEAFVSTPVEITGAQSTNHPDKVYE